MIAGMGRLKDGIASMTLATVATEDVTEQTSSSYVFLK